MGGERRSIPTKTMCSFDHVFAAREAFSVVYCEMEGLSHHFRPYSHPSIGLPESQPRHNSARQCLNIAQDNSKGPHFCVDFFVVDQIARCVLKTVLQTMSLSRR